MKVSALIRVLRGYLEEDGDHDVCLRTQSHSVVTERLEGGWQSIPMPTGSILQGEGIEHDILDVREIDGVCNVSATRAVATFEKVAIDYLWLEASMPEKQT